MLVEVAFTLTAVPEKALDPVAPVMAVIIIDGSHDNIHPGMTIMLPYKPRMYFRVIIFGVQIYTEPTRFVVTRRIE